MDSAREQKVTGLIEIGNCWNDELVARVVEIRKFFWQRSGNSLLEWGADTLPDATTFDEVVALQDEVNSMSDARAKAIVDSLYSLGVIGWLLAEIDKKNLWPEQAFERISAKEFPREAFTNQLCTVLLQETLDTLEWAVGKDPVRLRKKLDFARKVSAWTEPMAQNFNGPCNFLVANLKIRITNLL
jgi:hypothetical protein